MAQDSSKGTPAGQGAAPALLKPLRLELKQGCLDKAASGGLEAYAARWAPDQAFLDIFKGYGGMAPARRRRAVEAALRRLENIVAPPPPPPPAPKTARAAPPPPADAGGGLSVMGPTTAISSLPGLGPKRVAALRGLGLATVEDLLRHLPRAWQDRSNLLPIASLSEGALATVQGLILSSVNIRLRGRFTLTEVAVQDHSGSVSAVYFNQPYQQKRFKPGEAVVLSGKVERRGRRLQLLNPEAEVLPKDGEELVHTGRIVPLYPLAKEVSQRVFRGAAWKALGAAEALEDPLPEALRRLHGLGRLGPSLKALHFPPDLTSLDAAKRRLVFDEFFCLGLALEARRRREQAEEAPRFETGTGLAARLLAGLPFQPTAAQARVWGEISADLGRGRPMRRLLQGDVGSGKTLLAALSLASAVSEGWQGALMAPTEVLAEQLHANLCAWLDPLGVEVLRLTQSQSGRGRKEVLAHLASGQPLAAVGTQALIQEGVEFGRLGLAVIDEQHRFGVAQRLSLAQKARLKPHVLVMTATPIPRTLAMTAYGDLDLSLLDELPPGRTPIATRWLKPAQREQAYDLIRSQVAQGRQAYVVYALVDESDKTEWKAATQAAEELATEVFPDLKVALLHGRLKPEEKESVMSAFKAGQTQVLCSTTVIEVGVDVPNATVMLVEDADRFGLAQLHQLRGRVGRGAAASHCLLLGEGKSEEGKRRLEVMCSSTDGFVIAEEDLRLRGPGELLGLRQSGLPELKLADLVKDQALLVEAREAARGLLEADPGLDQPGHGALRRLLEERYATKLALGRTG